MIWFLLAFVVIFLAALLLVLRVPPTNYEAPPREAERQ